MPNAPAVIYARISLDRDSDHLGVDRQLDECRSLADRRYDVRAEFVDNSISAMGKKRRPGYEAMRDYLAANAGTTLLAWHPDRITRSPRELEDLIDLFERTGTKVVTAQAGDYDLSTPSGRMTARVVGAVARQESEHKSERMKSRFAQDARAGKRRLGAQRAFGYTIDGNVESIEADVLRDIAGRLLAGESLTSVTRWLNETQVPSVNGKAWQTKTVSNILTNARLIGARKYLGEVVAHGVYPAVLDRTTHDRLRLLLLDPNRRTNGGMVRKHLLSGLLVCGRDGCGRKLVSRSRFAAGGKPRTAAYACSKGHHVDPATGQGGCGRCQIDAAVVERFVVDAVLRVLDDPQRRSLIVAADAGQRERSTVLDDEQVRAELAAIDERDAELAARWASGDLSDAAWSAARATLNERRSKLTATVRAGSSSIPPGLARLIDPTPLTPRSRRIPSREETWDHLGLDVQRQVLRALIERVVVAPPASRSDARSVSRIDVKWQVNP